MSDEDVKTYSRGGRLAFTADVLGDHIGETCTLSFWIKLAEGSVEGHTVLVYPYQNRGISLHTSKEISPTAEWQFVELTGKVKDWGTDDGSTYDGTSETYTYNGIVYTYGELYFYDLTGSQKYDVYGISLTLHGSGGGCVHD